MVVIQPLVKQHASEDGTVERGTIELGIQVAARISYMYIPTDPA